MIHFANLIENRTGRRDDFGVAGDGDRAMGFLRVELDIPRQHDHPEAARAVGGAFSCRRCVTQMPKLVSSHSIGAAPPRTRSNCCFTHVAFARCLANVSRGVRSDLALVTGQKMCDLAPFRPIVEAACADVA